MSPVLVALDFPSGDEATAVARMVEEHVMGFKVGLELIMAEGPAVIERVVELGKPVFCDAKLHDIPNTVEGAARQLGRLGVRWLTVHASGGSAMMRAAVEGLAHAAPGESGVLAVTVLTSLDSVELDNTGVSGGAQAQVRRLAELAHSAGAEGVVCSVGEVRIVAAAAPGLLRVTPGIRPAGSDPGDQARVATPGRAVAEGADLLVVGRPITRASDPAAAAQAVAAEANV